ncbi:MFS multidrug transporter [Colletotrichum musicola]|uniref:MFS multidrug transporter n=1 Tax=Colletotrichum musicola TaxID=2175873 RepID=A0A8H6NI70_9PEZI|nr:MFS multidrug transporter [Colletotrichum musicola]
MESDNKNTQDMRAPTPTKLIKIGDEETQTSRPPIPVTDLSAGIVGWENQDDSNMPMNFSKAEKITTIALVGSFAFVTPFASSISASAQTQLLRDLGGGDDSSERLLVTMTVAIYVLGFSIGPLLLSPLSELHGRRPLILVSDLLFTVWSLACALAPSLPALVAFRFFEGVGGSGCLTITAGVLGDLFAPHERGRAMSWFQLGPNTAPFIAPIVGGYMTQSIGWRWDFWLCTIMGALVTVASIFFLRESNSRVLIRRKTRRMKTDIGRDDLVSCYADIDGASQTEFRYLAQSLVRPLRMLVLFPALLLLSIAGAIYYGLQYLLLVTLAPVFGDVYGFSAGETGLVYLAIGFGCFFGLFIFHFTSDRSVARQTKCNGGEFTPEMRAPLAIWGSVILPATFFIYGWCAQYRTHWIIPVLSLIPFSCGLNLLSMPLTTYVIDCYTVYAASAMAANMALKSICGAFLPLAGPAVYDKMGLGWGNTILGFIALAMTPMPVVIWKFGKVLRKKDLSRRL